MKLYTTFKKRKLCITFQRKLSISNTLNAKRGHNSYKKWHIFTRPLFEVHQTKVIPVYKIDYVKACSKKSVETVFAALYVPKGTQLLKKDAKLERRRSLKPIKKLYSQFYVNMVQRVGEKFRKLCISNILSS